MLDHLTLPVSNYVRSKAFYQAALKPLSYNILKDFGQFCGFGVVPKPDFWIGTGQPTPQGIHLAFRANSRAEVDAFYQAALAAGGTDNGAPGPRPHYHIHYYGAFVLDPDGYNIEAVCHTPE